MLVALPSAIAFGVTIFSPLGAEFGAKGALAGMLGVTALGLIAATFGGTQRLISAPCAPAAAVLSALTIQMTQQGSGVGAVFATLLYVLTVVSLPMLLDREVDFVTAMLTSFAVVTESPVVMLSWGALIGALLFLGVAGGLQLVRDDLAWQQATLSQYLRGPYGLLLRTMPSARSMWARAAPAVVKPAEFTSMRDSSSTTCGKGSASR